MDILLVAEGTLTPDESKQHVSYRFFIDKPLYQITIVLSYGPKELADADHAKKIIRGALPDFTSPDQLNEPDEAYLENFLPLKNLLTVSLDDSNGFRGSAHRQSPEQHIFLTNDHATPGFLPGQLRKGEWSITLSAHAIVTDWCHYQILVIGEGEEDNIEKVVGM